VELLESFDGLAPGLTVVYVPYSREWALTRCEKKEKQRREDQEGTARLRLTLLQRAIQATFPSSQHGTT